MPYKDPEKQKEYRRLHYLKNKELYAKNRDEWRKKNPDKLKEQINKYNLLNTEYRMLYKQLPRVKELQKSYMEKNRDKYNVNRNKKYHKYKTQFNLRNKIYYKSGVYISDEQIIRDYDKLPNI